MQCELLYIGAIVENTAPRGRATHLSRQFSLDIALIARASVLWPFPRASTITRYLVTWGPSICAFSSVMWLLLLYSL